MSFLVKENILISPVPFPSSVENVEERSIEVLYESPEGSSQGLQLSGEKPQEVKDQEGKTELFKAVEEGDYYRAEKLIEKGWDVNTVDIKKNSVLLAAIKYFNISILTRDKINQTGKQYSLIELLLEAKADPLQGDEEGQNAWDWAVILQDCTLLELLAKYSTPKISSNTVMTHCGYDTPHFLARVLEYDPDLALADPQGISFVHRLAYEGNLPFLKMLAEKAPKNFQKLLNVKMSAHGGDAETPLHLTLEKKFYETAAFLVEQGSDVSICSLEEENYYREMAPDFKERLEWLLGQGFDINVQDDLGNNILHRLLLLENFRWTPEIFVLCVQKGAKIDQPNKENKTPIDLALEKERVEAGNLLMEIVKMEPFLFKEGLSPEEILREDCFGRNAFHYVIQQKDLGLLQQLAAVVDVRKVSLLKSQGLNLLHYACQVGDHKVVEFLWQKGIDPAIPCASKQWDFTKNGLELALEGRHKDLVAWFLQNFDESSRLWERKDLIVLAAEQGEKAVIDRVFAHSKEDQYFGSEELLKGISLALKKGYIPLALSLLEHKEVTYPSSHEGDETLFAVAIEKGDYPFLQRLLEKFPDSPAIFWTKGKTSKTTPLDCALTNKREDMVRLLWPLYLEKALKNKDILDETRFVEQTIQSDLTDLVEKLESYPKFQEILRGGKINYKLFGYSSLTPLCFAVLEGKIHSAKALLRLGAPLRTEVSFFDILPHDGALFCAFFEGDAELIKLIAEEMDRKRQLIHFSSLFGTATKMAQKRKQDPQLVHARIFSFLLERKCPLLSLEGRERITTYFSQCTLQGALLSIFEQGIALCGDDNSAWDKYLLEVEQFVSVVKTRCTVHKGNLSLEKTHDWIAIQVFQHLFQGMNPELIKVPHVLGKLAELLQKVQKTEDYGQLFVALQVSTDLDDVSRALDAAAFYDTYGELPPKALFKKEESLRPKEREELQEYLAKRKCKDIGEDRHAWLAYYQVYRSRKGLDVCHYILKNRESFPALLPSALSAMERIGVAQKNKHLQRKQTTLLQQIIRETAEETLKIQALKVLTAIEPHYKNAELLGFLIQELSQVSLKYRTAVIKELGSYEYSASPEISLAVKKLSAELESKEEEIRFSAAMALSGIPDEEGLLLALGCVRSTTWKHYDTHYGVNRSDAIGNFLLFRHRPDHIHDNRHALTERIENQLARLAMQDKNFSQEVEERHQRFVSDPSSDPELSALHKRCKDLETQHARYFSTPLFFPKETDLIRGLSTRKGDEGFKESILDLIRQGAGSCALTEGDASVDGGTWKKIGHIFASHNQHLFFNEEEGCTYFKSGDAGAVTDSALVIFPAEYYTSQSLKGQARIERENTYNNVIYKGIPKHWIKAIYLPPEYKADMDLVAGSLPLTEVVPQLSSKLFKDLPMKELVEFRRHLQAEDGGIGAGLDHPIPFHQRIRFFPSGNAKVVGEHVRQDGMRFVEESEVLAESLKWSIARDLVRKKQGVENFRSQAEMLSDLDDRQFIQQ